jgi:hypothetical protein
MAETNPLSVEELQEYDVPVETTAERWARDMEHGEVRKAITPGPNKPSVT